MVNRYGELVGVVVSSLDANVAFKRTGAMPQNVNYALKGTYVLAFLDSFPEVTNRLEANRANNKNIEIAFAHVESCVVMVIAR